MESINQFFSKNKRILVVLLIAALFIAAVWYFMLGREVEVPAEESSSQPLGSVPRTGGSAASQPSGFPLQWSQASQYTKQLQVRLNQTILLATQRGIVLPGTDGKSLQTDGMLGDKTLAVIKAAFPNIGAQVATSRQVTKTQYDIIINSKAV